MIRIRLLSVAAAAAFVSSAAMAFQEQQSTAPRQQDAAPVVTPLAPDAAPGSKGTPVRIPGLGTLGVIPKMDFGLELLYGAADQPVKRPDANKSDSDDVLVGGRIKHKF
jgi:hypothetical protein